MEFREQRLSVREAKEIDMVDYLSGLGYKPSKIRNADYWYLSPLRNERTPSFKVNRELNRWYDHGMGKGGNLIDFGIAWHHCTVGELLNKLSGRFSFQKPLLSPLETLHKPEPGITILGDFALTSFGLLRYLSQRHIPVELAGRYCREVRYELNGKIWYGIGFKNDSGGWEIRNSFFKAGSSPKDMTTFKNGSREAVVFEGFMDFLSFKVLHKNLPEKHLDYVILNSVSFFEKARAFMERHQVIRLFLDRDRAGQNCSWRALSIGAGYIDESGLYKDFKDLNQWSMNSGRSQKKHLRPGLR